MAQKKATAAEAEPKEAQVEVHGIEDPGAASEFDEASGAIIEPEILRDVDPQHESVDNNPRAGTTAEQNAIDFNDANRRTPEDPDFAGMGLDPTPYGGTK